MKKIFFILILFGFPYSVVAALSPVFYEKSKKQASEEWLVSVKEVHTYKQSNHWIAVKAKVKVLSVYRTSSRVKRGQMKVIRYRSRKMPSGMIVSAPIPVLKAAYSYKLYVNYSKHKNDYRPAAGNQSFERIH